MDGVSGILIEDENYEDLKNALIKLIENKDNRENMGKNGRRIYEEKFTVAEISKLLKMKEDEVKEIINY